MTAVAGYIRRFARHFHRPRCSACHLPRAAGRRLISGPSVYICESCVREAAARVTAVQQPAVCSFCGHAERPVFGRWPQVSICRDCVGIAEDILADDRHRDPPSGKR